MGNGQKDGMGWVMGTTSWQGAEMGICPSWEAHKDHMARLQSDPCMPRACHSPLVLWGCAHSKKINQLPASKEQGNAHSTQIRKDPSTLKLIRLMRSSQICDL